MDFFHIFQYLVTHGYFRKNKNISLIIWTILSHLTKVSSLIIIETNSEYYYFYVLLFLDLKLTYNNLQFVD